MSLNNQQIVEKVDTTDIATAGKLNAEQAKQFIDYMVEQTEIFDKIQFKRMRNLNGVAYDIDVSRRMIRRGVEGTAPTNYGSIQTGKNEISLLETILPMDITDQFKIENVQGPNAADKIMRLIATQYSNDLQDLAINGNADAQNTAPAAANYVNVTNAELEFLQIYNGWLKLVMESSTKHVVEETYSEDIGLKGLLKTLFKGLPNKYKKASDLTIFTTWEMIEDYVNELTGRVTAMGDKTLLSGNATPTYMGRKMVGVSAMPDNTAILTSPSNLAFGIYLDNIKTEYQRNARKRQDEYTITSYTGCQVANYDSLVLLKYEN